MSARQPTPAPTGQVKPPPPASPPARDGGPAFPVAGVFQQGSALVRFDGMSLRDFFAGQALAGILANSSPDGFDKYTSTAADTAYDYADAMLAARERAS